MKKLLKYKDGSEYIVGGIVSIEPNAEPMEEWDLSDLTDEEFKELRKNPKDKNLRKKMKRIK